MLLKNILFKVCFIKREKGSAVYSQVFCLFAQSIKKKMDSYKMWIQNSLNFIKKSIKEILKHIYLSILPMKIKS